MQESSNNLQEQLHLEFEKRNRIQEKIKLVNDLNQSLKKNIFKIVKEIIDLQKMNF